MQGPGTGKAVDGLEADITAGPLPHAGTGKQRRNLYWRNHGRTLSGISGGPRSRGGQESLCWWPCSVRGSNPEEGEREGGKKKEKQTFIRKTNRAENLTSKTQTTSPHTPQRIFLLCCNNTSLIHLFTRDENSKRSLRDVMIWVLFCYTTDEVLVTWRIWCQ